METSRKTQAIVLSHQDYRENDSLVGFYTLDYSKLSLIVRGSKKLQSKLAGHLEPFNFVDLMIISGKSRDYVGSAVLRESFLTLKDDLNSLYYAGQGLNWLNRLSEEGEADQEIFSLLLGYLSFFNNKKNQTLSQEEGEILFSFFMFKVLSKLGYKPQLQTCLNCAQKLKPGKNYFNLKNGGLICANCFKTIKEAEKIELLAISDNCIKLLRLLTDEETPTIPNLKIDKKLIKELSILTLGFLNYRF